MNIFESAEKAERDWASLTGYERKAILQKLGHRELFAMTADGMTLVNITIRFGERLGDALIKEVLAMSIA